MREMNRRFVVWGSAGHAKVLADVIELGQDQVVALVDNDPAAVSSLKGVPLCCGLTGLNEWLKAQTTPSTLCAAIAIGGARGRDRISIAQSLLDAALRLPATHEEARHDSPSCNSPTSRPMLDSRTWLRWVSSSARSVMVRMVI